MHKAGKYIVLEGGEHVGKTTQAQVLSAVMGAKLVREPGSTPVGEAIRGVILDPDQKKQVETEVLLHAAQRAELARTVLRPTLESGTHVVSDRSWLSSAAYQGIRGVRHEDIFNINHFALGPLVKPDLCILLDADPHELEDRAEPGYTDYYEQMDMDFHVRLRKRFLELGKMYGAVILDATQDQHTVADQITDAVQANWS